jgi:two-component system NtrC family sensor kinase
MAGETVLIIEDRRENIVHLANNVLKPNGYQVITAMDGQRGLQRILADQPDLVVLDMNMPKMDGLEILSTLRERQVQVPVILTTFYGSEQVAEQALRLGAADYVVKPYDLDEMLSAIQKALARRPQAPGPAKVAERMEETMPLTRQVERWMRDMNILTRVGKALVALLDLPRVSIRTVEAVIYVTRSDYGVLYLRDEGEGAGLRLYAARGPHDRRAHVVDRPVSEGLAVEVAASGQTLLLPEAVPDVLLFDIVGKPLGPIAAAPLLWQRQVIGVLVAARDRGEAPFGEADVEWLGGLADYAAIAIRNARAYEQQAQASTAPQRDDETMLVWRSELAQLAEQLQAATENARRLATLVAGEAPDPDQAS